MFFVLLPTTALYSKPQTVLGLDPYFGTLCLSIYPTDLCCRTFYDGTSCEWIALASEVID